MQQPAATLKKTKAWSLHFPPFLVLPFQTPHNEQPRNAPPHYYYLSPLFLISELPYEDVRWSNQKGYRFMFPSQPDPFNFGSTLFLPLGFGLLRNPIRWYSKSEFVTRLRLLQHYSWSITCSQGFFFFFSFFFSLLYLFLVKLKPVCFSFVFEWIVIFRVNNDKKIVEINMILQIKG